MEPIRNDGIYNFGTGFDAEFSIQKTYDNKFYCRGFFTNIMVYLVVLVL
jgi:hypothetical protein